MCYWKITNNYNISKDSNNTNGTLVINVKKAFAVSLSAFTGGDSIREASNHSSMLTTKTYRFPGNTTVWV